MTWLPEALSRRVLDRASKALTQSPNVPDGTVQAVIEAGDAAMICRIGSVELAAVRRLAIADRLRLADPSRMMNGATVTFMHRNAGVFPPTREAVCSAAHRIATDLGEADWVGTWGNFGESAVVRRYAPNADPFPLSHLDPFRSERPWTRALAGKNVLIVHPFASTIERQLQVRGSLHRDLGGGDLLPAADYQVLPAVQSIGGTLDFPDWDRALESMADRVKESPADVVLVAAGAYGLSLAAAAKTSGKVGIHVGGVLQVIFGVRGRRWDGGAEYERRATHLWCRPTGDETPEAARQVEGGCYW